MSQVWEPVKPGIGNAQWIVSDDGMAFMQNVRHIMVDYRDRYGNKWRVLESASNELINDPGGARMVLEILWRNFKRYIERRFNEPQPYESADLNPRSRQWKYEHPEEAERFYPAWDWDDDDLT